MSGLAKRGALALAATVLTLTAVELAFRIVDPPEPTPACLRMQGVAREEHCVFNDYHPILGFEAKPGFRGRYGEPASHNSLGFRGPEIDPSNAAGRRRVVFLGDSQTWGFGLRDDETLPAVVQALLDGDGAPPGWEAINLGVSGYGPGQSLLRYLIRGRALRPEIVVFVVFPNDLVEVGSTRAWNVPKPRFYLGAKGELCLGNVPPERLAGWESNQIVPTHPFWARFATLRFLMNREWSAAILAWLSRPDLESIADVQACITAGPGSDSDAITLLGRLLLRLDEILRSNGQKLLVVFTPIRFEIEGPQAHPYYRSLEHELRRHGIPSVELRRELWEYAARHPDPVFDSSGHLRAAAIRDVVAPAVAAAIRRMADRADATNDVVRQPGSGLGGRGHQPSPPADATRPVERTSDPAG